jgi:outer membrane protein assembly complex protein YaeT
MPILLVLAILAGQPQTPAPQLSAQSPSAAAAYAGKTIVRADIAIEGQIVTEPALRDLLQTRVGAPLSISALRETIAHLYSLGRFQDISVDASALDAGVALRYDLVPIHSVQQIEFEGNLGLGRSSLRDAVTSRFGAAPPATRAAAVAEMLQSFYRDRGYLSAAIRAVVEERHDPEETILRFQIESGPRASVRNVEIVGDPGTTRERFLETIHANPGRIYQPTDIDARLTGYVDDLRHGGKYEARASYSLVFQSDDGLSVDLSVTIDQGPAVTIRYEGDALPKNRLEELVPVRREGSVDEDILEDSERRIVAFLNQQGYWKAAATAARQEADNRVDIVFNVQKGPQYRIDGGPQVSGNASLPPAEIQEQLVNLEDGELFISANLDAAAAAIRGLYLRRGFAQAKVESAANEVRPPQNNQGYVRPVITITEGPLIRIGEIAFAGNAAIATPDLAGRLTVSTGQPYYEPEVVQDRENILTAYLNRGFADATVQVVPTVNDARVDLRFNISEGPQSIVDHIMVVGNVRTDARIIEREVQLKTGEPLGLDALFETRRRLGALGLFRRIRIDQIQHGETNRHDIIIHVEEAPATTIGYGGGVELAEVLVSGAGGEAEGDFELAPRGFFEVGRRNLGGKNRSANLYTRLSLRSDRSRPDAAGSRFGFPEYRVVATFREPRTFGWNADVTLTGAVEQGVRSTFKFSRKGVNAEIIRSLSPTIRASGRYTFATTRTFDEALDEQEQALIDRVFPQVRLSAFAATIIRDTRDDALDATRGWFLSADNSVAARAFGGEVGFIKTFVQAQTYRLLPIGRRVVFAARVAVGLADGFPREVQSTDGSGAPVTAIIEDLPASERFFAGGDTTMRGFALDSVGTPATITDTGFPRGGNGLLLLNGELRTPVWKSIGAAFFVDSGNVFERVTDIDIGELRASAGFGLRYRSPLGPLRFDIGFKLGDLRVEDKRRYALHFSFGQIF